jgi:phage gpG-like protein
MRYKNIDKDFRWKKRLLNKKVDGTIPKIIGNEHKRGFRNSFREQSFYDYGSRRWPRPDRKDTSTPFPPPTKSHLTRDTLIGKAGAGGSGLQDSFKDYTRGDKIIIENTKPYAGAHNEGAKIKIPVTEKMRKFAWAMYYKAKKRGAKNYESWRGLALTKKSSITVNIPQRKFMGHSKKIDDNVDKELQTEIDQIL